MLKPLPIGLVLVVITFAIHAVGSTNWMEFLIRRYAGRDGDWRAGTTVWVLISTGAVLLALHMLEALVWAVAYWFLPDAGSFQGFEQAVYFSLVTFTTLGYGDFTLNPEWHLLSGIEAVNGILLGGWSTALLFVVVQRSWQMTHTPTK